MTNSVKGPQWAVHILLLISWRSRFDPEGNPNNFTIESPICLRPLHISWLTSFWQLSMWNESKACVLRSCKHGKWWVCRCVSVSYFCCRVLSGCQLFKSAILICHSLNQDFSGTSTTSSSFPFPFVHLHHFSLSSVLPAPGLFPSFYSVCHLFLSLSSQLSVALEEKSSLQAETRSLKEKLSRFDFQDASTTAITGKKLLLLQSQMEQLQEENYR